MEDKCVVDLKQTLCDLVNTPDSQLTDDDYVCIASLTQVLIKTVGAAEGMEWMFSFSPLTARQSQQMQSPQDELV